MIPFFIDTNSADEKGIKTISRTNRIKVPILFQLRMSLGTKILCILDGTFKRRCLGTTQIPRLKKKKLD